MSETEIRPAGWVKDAGPVAANSPVMPNHPPKTHHRRAWGVVWRSGAAPHALAPQAAMAAVAASTAPSPYTPTQGANAAQGESTQA